MSVARKTSLLGLLLALFGALCYTVTLYTAAFSKNALAMKSEEAEECGENPLEELESTTKLAVVISLLALCVTMTGGYVINDILKISILPEAAFAVIIGIVISGVSYSAQADHGAHLDDIMKFNKEFFFVWLLPPIIFEAGYNMKREAFFINIVPTTLYAFLGTFMSTFIVGGMLYYAGQIGISYELDLLNCLIFGSLISATDPVTVLAVFQALGVNTNLFSMVFGESVLNDAVALVLYRTMVGFRCTEFSTDSVISAIVSFTEIFVFSLLIGVFLGLLSALLFKLLDLRHHELHRVEAALTVVFPWSSYFFAESCGFSGIVAILFAGITMAHYTLQNISPEAQTLTRDMYKVAATIAETFVFVYLGMAFFGFQEHGRLLMLTDIKYSFIAIAILACLIARLTHIYPFSWLVNIFRSETSRPAKIPSKYMFLMWYSGLRGGVAFAIAVANFEDSASPETDGSLLILQATLFIAAFTIFFMGGTITSLCRYFDVLEKPEQQQPATLEMQPSRFSRVDEKVFKPLFTLKHKPHGGHVKLQEEH